MKSIAIIPARGGSKRIPRKNIKEFLGKPIIAYSIEMAIKSNLFEEIIVSTDDVEIAEISVKYGAKVPFYREETADDYSTLADVIEEVKIKLSALGKKFDYICLLLPTAPLVSIENLSNSLDTLLFKDGDSIRPVVRFSYPIQRAVYLENGRIDYIHPEYYTARSQDLPTTYHDAGLFYWMKWTSRLNSGVRLGFEIPEFNAQDIDTESDWRMCELKYKIINYE